MGLSRRAYARHRADHGLPGGTDMAVRRAITYGRISLLPDGSIDPAVADVEWEKNTLTHSTEKPQIRIETKRPIIPSAPPSAPVGRTVDNDQENNTSSGIPSLNVSRSLVEAYKARMIKMAYEEKRKTLLSAEDVSKDAFEIARRVRNRLLDIPQRVAAMLAAENNQQVIENILKGELMLACEDLSK